MTMTPFHEVAPTAGATFHEVAPAAHEASRAPEQTTPARPPHELVAEEWHEHSAQWCLAREAEARAARRKRHPPAQILAALDAER